MPEEPRVQERVPDAQAPDDRDRSGDRGHARQDQPDRRWVRPASGTAPRSALRPAAQQRQRAERPDQERGEQHRAHHVHAPAPARRVPAAARRPGQREGADAHRHVDVEDPAPCGRKRIRQGRARGNAETREGDLRVDDVQDRGAQERPGGHPQERERTDDAQGPGPAGAREQVGRGGRGHRHQRAATGRLDQPRDDQQLERGRGAGQRGADGEQAQRPEEHAAVAPQVRQPPRQRHRDDIHQQVAVDDPGGLAEAGPGGQVGDDRRQGDRRDHQLEAGQEHPRPKDGEEHEGVATREGVHVPSVGCRDRHGGGCDSRSMRRAVPCRRPRLRRDSESRGTPNPRGNVTGPQRMRRGHRSGLPDPLQR